MENIASVASAVPSKLLLSLSPLSATAIATTGKSCSDRLHPLRYCLLVAYHALLFLLRLVSRVLHARSIATPVNHGPVRRVTLPSSLAEEGSTYAARALAHVLGVVTRVPVSSRKYELARALADQLLDENLRCGVPTLAAINRAALDAAFSRTLRYLETAAGAAARERRTGGRKDGSVERILGGVRSSLRLWADPSEDELGFTEEESASSGGERAEKLATEVLWLAEKMAACGGPERAVRRWGTAAGLARLALAAEPRLQGTFVRISVFLLKHARCKDGDEVTNKGTVMTQASCKQMDMLMSWLPLLCRASNGTDAPMLSRTERAETVTILEEIIEKLSWDQQEEVLALWLHHFTSCPDSDWPDLQQCYTRWYSVSRKLIPLTGKRDVQTRGSS